MGRISEIFADQLTQKRGEVNVSRIIREDEAVAEVAKNAKPGDVVIFIVNDDIKRSLDFIKTSFDAEVV